MATSKRQSVVVSAERQQLGQGEESHLSGLQLFSIDQDGEGSVHKCYGQILQSFLGQTSHRSEFSLIGGSICPVMSTLICSDVHMAPFQSYYKNPSLASEEFVLPSLEAERIHGKLTYH